MSDLDYCMTCKNRGRYVDWSEGKGMEHICDCKHGDEFRKWHNEIESTLKNDVIKNHQRKRNNYE